MLELLGYLVRTHATMHTRSRLPRSLGPIARARARIDDDPSSPLTLADLAADAGMSRFQLLRGFAHEMGLPPHAYRMQRRMTLARQLIAQWRDIGRCGSCSGLCRPESYDSSIRTIAGDHTCELRVCDAAITREGREELLFGARSAAGRMTALSLGPNVRGHRFQMRHYRYCARDPLSRGFEPLSFAYFSLRQAKKSRCRPAQGRTLIDH